MAAWNMVLGDLKKPDEPEQQDQDWHAVLWIAEAKGGSDHREGGKPLQASRAAGHGPKLDRRKGEGRNGKHGQPSDPAKEDLGCHA